MRDPERELAIKLAPIIRCARKMLGYEQTDLATLMDINQSKISRFESAKLAISSYNWMKFCEIVHLDLGVIRYEFIEKPSNATIQNKRRIGKFLLPAKYSMNAGVKIREIFPLVEQYKTQEKWQKLFKKEFKFDSDYFYNLDHQINLTFVNDLIENLKDKKLYKKANMAKNFQKLLASEVFKRYSKGENLERFEKKLGCDFNINYTEDTVVIEAKNHVKPDQLDNYFEYKKWFTEMFLDKKLEIEREESKITLHA